MYYALIPYPGGKARLAQQIIKYFPPHRVYAEPFAGGASVFFTKPPSEIEVLNDIDHTIINLYRVLQDPQKFEELRHRLTYTPYSRAEFVRARRMLLNPEGYSDVDLAWAKLVAVSYGFAGKYDHDSSWGRSIESSLPDRQTRRLERLAKYHERIRHAYLDCTDAIDFIKYWDTKDTLFYLDPPYVLDTRKEKQLYAHELDDEYHSRLADVLLGIRGKAVLSGYDNPIYDRLLECGWRKVRLETACCMFGITRRGGDPDQKPKSRPKRVECLWMNFGADPINGLRL